MVPLAEYLAAAEAVPPPPGVPADGNLDADVMVREDTKEEEGGMAQNQEGRVPEHAAPVVREEIPVPAPAVAVGGATVATCHGMEWKAMQANTTNTDCNGPVARREWSVSTATGEVVRPGSDPQQERSRLDYFLMMFPPTQLQLIVVLTSRELTKISAPATTKGEILKFIGVIILATRFEFQSRASLWSTTSLSRYTPAPSLGKTGMSRSRFDLLWKSIRFSDQPDERPGGVTSEQHRWMLVDDFVLNFNSHRESQVVPSWVLCVDESISRWYGQGGDWINLGLPMYVAIDRKPKNGCEIQDVACASRAS
jgi:hypothetical protein